MYSNDKSAVKTDDKLGQSCTCKEKDACCHLLFLISIGRTTHVTRDMCFPGEGTHITRDMCFPGGGTHITRDMCFPGEGTHITRDKRFELEICKTVLNT